MPARPGADGDDAIDTRARRLFGVAARDHIVKDKAAVTMHGLNQFLDGTERRDDEGDPVFDDKIEIGGKARI